MRIERLESDAGRDPGEKCGLTGVHGQLCGTGRVSADAERSLLELTWNGKEPLDLGRGATRNFIEDGDTLTLTGRCRGDE